jgi:uncharacterized linocin/CFP29 family protein
MSLSLLNRDDAPFDQQFWNTLDDTIKNVAQAQLSVRKLLYTEGPCGLGMQFVPGNEKLVEAFEGGPDISLPQGVPLVQLSSSFNIAARDIEAFQKAGLKINLENLINSLLKITTQEDKVLLYGIKASGLYGLMSYPEALRMKLDKWEQVGDAVESILKAVEILDKEGFHGPYSLALSTNLYNKLFRRYPNTEIIEMDHLKTLVTEGIIKSAAIESGGVLVASAQEYASIVLGQDLVAGFEGPSGRDYVFTLSETVALRIVVPKSICVLESPV